MVIIGNTNNNDGCSSTCQVESLWTCNKEPSICQRCGNNKVEGTEQCNLQLFMVTVTHKSFSGDDGNLSNEDGCNSTCGTEAGYTCLNSPSVCSFCGNGIVSGNDIYFSLNFH